MISSSLHVLIAIPGLQLNESGYLDYTHTCDSVVKRTCDGSGSIHDTTKHADSHASQEEDEAAEATVARGSNADTPEGRKTWVDLHGDCRAERREAGQA